MNKIIHPAHHCLMLFVLAAFFGYTSQKKLPSTNWLYQDTAFDNQIKSAYILSVEIKNVSNSTDVIVKNTEVLLVNNSGQAFISGSNGVCSMTGNNGANAGIFIDFGKELHGGIYL